MQERRSGVNGFRGFGLKYLSNNLHTDFLIITRHYMQNP